MDIKKSIAEAKRFLGLDKYNSLKINCVSGNKQYSISVKKENNDITIFYSDLVTLYYGLSLLKQNIGKQRFQINIKRKFKHNGSMFDCSRNQPLNIKTIKEVILLHALMGLNRFMLYTEDVYQIEGEPYFGYFRGRYTKKEIGEIVNYAKGFGVDVIPCIQTLSHLNQAIRWSPYSILSDTAATLNTENKNIYVLIEKMIKTCKENFSSKYIHIGMDEAGDMGFSAFINENRLIDKRKYFLNHLRKVVAICKKYDLKPMMWADMFFKIDPHHQAAWYDFKGKFDKSTKEIIPDVELVYWNYYDDQINRYDNNLKTALDTKKDVIFAGGLIRWVGYVPNIAPSITKSISGLKAAIKNNIDSVFVSTWGDAGSGSSVVSLYVAMALYSSFDYSDGSIEKASELLESVTGLSYKQWLSLELPNRLRDDLLPFENPSYYFLYQDVLLGLFDTRVKNSFERKYLAYSKLLKEISAVTPRYGYAFKTYSLLCDLLSTKIALGKTIRLQYKNNDKNGLKQSAIKIKLAIKKLDAFIKSYAYLWHKENKAFGHEINDGRLGFLRQRLVSAYLKVSAYINNKLNSIEELEEQSLPYNTIDDNEPICVNVWSQAISTNNSL